MKSIHSILQYCIVSKLVNIQGEIEDSDECPFKQTNYFFQALESLPRNNSAIAQSQLDVANRFFITLCGQTPNEREIDNVRMKEFSTDSEFTAK